MKDSGAKAIVIVSNFAHTLEKVVYDTPVKHVILTRMGDNLGLAKGTLVNFVVKYVKKLVPKYNLPHASTMRQALAKGATCSTSNPRSATRTSPSCNTPAGPPASPRGHADSSQHDRQR